MFSYLLYYLYLKKISEIAKDNITYARFSTKSFEEISKDYLLSLNGREELISAIFSTALSNATTVLSIATTAPQVNCSCVPRYV